MLMLMVMLMVRLMLLLSSAVAVVVVRSRCRCRLESALNYENPQTGKSKRPGKSECPSLGDPLTGQRQWQHISNIAIAIAI